MDFWPGLLGAILGGVLTMVGSAFQARLQAKQLEKQFEHERRMAQETHERGQIVAENHRIREMLEAQGVYGRKLMRAASAFQILSKKASTDEEMARMCNEALEMSGLSRSEPAPYPGFLQEEEIEDDELRKLVAEHREILMKVELAFGLMDAKELPEDCMELYKEADTLARQIGVRWRLLQRQGKPI